MNYNAAFMTRFFRPVDSVVWDLMSGRVGFQTGEGICSIELGPLDDEGEAVEAQVTINIFEDFGLPVPAFAQSVPAESIAAGDMIYSSSSNRVLGWVVKKSSKSLKLMKPDGTRSSWTPPKVQMLGFDSGVMVLRSLMNMLPGGSSQLGQMQNMMMPLMMMNQFGSDSDSDSDEDSGGFGMGMDLKQIMPMLLFNQIGLGSNGAAPDQNANTNMMQMVANMMQMSAMSKMMAQLGTSNQNKRSKLGSGDVMSKKRLDDRTKSFFDD